jgi:hypothetical protein
MCTDVTVTRKHVNSPDPLSPPVIDPKYFGNKFGQSLVRSFRSQFSQYGHPTDVAFHAITTAWLRKWMHTEPINEQLVKENIPGNDRVNAFDEWAAYARSNAIVSPAVLASIVRDMTRYVAPTHSRLSIL